LILSQNKLICAFSTESITEMLLDTRTLSFANMAGATVFSLAMLFIWGTRKTYPGFGLWTIGNVAAASGFFLLSLRDQIPDFFTIVVAYMFLFAQNILLFEGIRRFRGKSGINWINLALAFILLLSLLYSTYINNNIEIRLIAISFIYAWVYFSCAIELVYTESESTRSVYWFIGILFLLLSLLMVARAIYVYVGPDLKYLFAPDNFHAYVFLLILLINFSLTFGFVILNSERLENELVDAQNIMQHMAETDYLTGIYNNRHFYTICHNEILRAQRYRNPIAIIIFDIDNFKHINDTYGHPEGDIVLIAIVEACQECLREIDTFSRLGGDEFGILLPETDLEAGMNVAERLRETIAATLIRFETTTIHVTASFGLSIVLPHEGRIDPALKRADMALYEAKKKQRNRVVAFPPDAPDTAQT
jgi:diguanylate cyclase (GGDEF)-like protein